MIQEFKSGNKIYEVFFADDGYIELYEKDNPNEGLAFENHKLLTAFVNGLTDILEEL